MDSKIIFLCKPFPFHWQHHFDVGVASHSVRTVFLLWEAIYCNMGTFFLLQAMISGVGSNITYGQQQWQQKKTQGPHCGSIGQY